MAIAYWIGLQCDRRSSEEKILKTLEDLIMSQATTKSINLQETLNAARTQTQEMIQQGVDISDPSIVTPLEAIANQYPDISSQCNQLLIDLVEQQIEELSHQEESQEVANEF